MPQLYGGGFQRKSLIKRVCNLQGGKYYRSAVPDAYSALMGVLHTYRYLEVGVPVTWIGTSPVSNYNNQINVKKNREEDLFQLSSDKSILMNSCLGTAHKKWSFLIFFYESYIASNPLALSFSEV